MTPVGEGAVGPGISPPPVPGGGTPAPTNSPTFTGTVTFPDGSTAASSGFAFVTKFTASGEAVFTGVTPGFVTSAPSFTVPNSLGCGFFAPAARTFPLAFPTIAAGSSGPVSTDDGQILYYSAKGTGAMTFVAAPLQQITGMSGGTYTVSITGFTTATFNWNDPASTLQSTLSDGTHGPAGTRVIDRGNGYYVFSVAGGVAMTANYSGLTGGGSASLTQTQVDGQAQVVIPAHCGVWVMNDGSNYFTVGTWSRASNTSLNATASTPTPTSGVAFTPSANQDCELSFAVSTAATFTVTMGPTTGAENTVLSSTALGIGTFFNKRIPAGWKVVITGTIADLENILAVTC